MVEDGKTLCVNVDIDTIRFYNQLYGIKLIDDNEIWEIGIPRLLNFFSENSIKANFFAIGSDLDTDSKVYDKNLIFKNVKLCENILSNGHSINSHSYHHNYQLINSTSEYIENDLNKNQEILKKITGKNNKIFRAPGYFINKKIYNVLEKLNINISSSYLPSTPYILLKNIIILKNSLLGKKTESIKFKGIFNSFQKRKIHYNKINKIYEFPISVIPYLDIPFVGTFLSYMGDIGLKYLGYINNQKNINLEFHVIDFLEAEDLKNNNILKKYQPDLNIPYSFKKKIYKAWFNKLLQNRKNLKIEEIIK